MAMKDPQARTKQILKDDIETIRAYADAFGVEMPDLDENGEVVGLPAPYPREVAGVVRSGYRIYELGQKAVETGMPCLNPILGRNSAEETWKESNDIYKYAEKFGQTVFQFVHSEATRHIDPLKGRELIEQSRGKGGITPKGEQARLQSEAALNAYFGRIMARMTPEQIDQMYALRGVLLDAIEAENDAMQKKISTQKQGGPVDDENI